MMVDLGISECSHTLILQDGDKFFLTTEAAEARGRGVAMQVEVKDGKIYFIGGADVVGMIMGPGLKKKFVSGKEMLTALDGDEPIQQEQPRSSSAPAGEEQEDGPPAILKEEDPCPPPQPSE